MLQNENKKIVSMHQPNYIPYLWFFYKVSQSDILLLTETDQYSVWDFHNRNIIRWNNWKHILTIPCKYSFPSAIKDVEFDCKILEKHKKTIQWFYRKSKNRDKAKWLIDDIYSYKWNKLYEFNSITIRLICNYLWIKTKIINVSDIWYEKVKNSTDEIIDLMWIIWWNIYISWIWWKNYIEKEKFDKSWIELRWIDNYIYHYNTYNKDFINNLSILDFIFNSDKYENLHNPW